MSAPAKTRVCKDCAAEFKSTGAAMPIRDAKYPGPRCYSHHNQRKREVRLANHGRRTLTVYGLTPEQYQALYAFQGGRCAICRVAKGNPEGDPRKRQLAVDHDHSCCPGKTSCGKCVRGLVCGPCNDVLAHFRDDRAKVQNMDLYLAIWPTQRIAAGASVYAAFEPGQTV